MSSLVPSGTVVEFRPAPGWKWVGFDGCLKVSASRSRVDLEGEMAVVDEDLIRLAAKLVGRGYGAVGFDDTPGAVTLASVEIDRGTLFSRAVVEGRETARTDTTGTFRVVCLPSTKAGVPPIPDPLPAHEGTWVIRPAATARTQCEGRRRPEHGRDKP